MESVHTNQDFNMNKLTIVTNNDDWDGMYLDGQLIDQGHQLDWEHILSKLGFILETKDVDNDWLSECGSLTSKLEYVKFAVED